MRLGGGTILARATFRQLVQADPGTRTNRSGAHRRQRGDMGGVVKQRASIAPPRATRSAPAIWRRSAFGSGVDADCRRRLRTGAHSTPKAERPRPWLDAGPPRGESASMDAPDP